MRKVFILLAVVAALAIPVVAGAVNINPGQLGTGCSGAGEFHFVAPGGTASTRLIVNFSDGGDINAPGLLAEYSNNGTAHWWVDGVGTIISASASPANRLVLSSYECDDKGKGK